MSNLLLKFCINYSSPNAPYVAVNLPPLDLISRIATREEYKFWSFYFVIFSLLLFLVSKFRIPSSGARYHAVICVSSFLKVTAGWKLADPQHEFEISCEVILKLCLFGNRDIKQETGRQFRLDVFVPIHIKITPHFQNVY